jgi:hypothetical protein
MQKRAQNIKTTQIFSIVIALIIILSLIPLTSANSLLIKQPKEGSQNSRISYAEEEKSSGNKDKLPETEIQGGKSDKKYKIGDKTYTIRRGMFTQDIYIESEDKKTQIEISDGMLEGKNPVIKEIELKDGLIHLTKTNGKEVVLPFNPEKSEITLKKRGDGFSMSFNNEVKENTEIDSSSKESQELINQLKNPQFQGKDVTYIDDPSKETNFLIVKSKRIEIERDDSTIKKEETAYTRAISHLELKDAKRGLLNMGYEKKEEGDKIEDIFIIDNSESVRFLLKGDAKEINSIENIKWMKISKPSSTESSEEADKVTISYSNGEYRETTKMELKKFQENYKKLKEKDIKEYTHAETTLGDARKAYETAYNNLQRAEAARKRGEEAIPPPFTIPAKPSLPKEKKTTPPTSKTGETKKSSATSKDEEEPILKWIKPVWMRKLLGINR